jgi:hydrogenase expression/formation protein HypC
MGCPETSNLIWIQLRGKSVCRVYKKGRIMCLAIPARVAELLPDDQARIELGGVHKVISLSLLEDVKVGDYLIVHVGYAIGKLDPDEAAQTLALFSAMGKSADPAEASSYI